MFFSSVRMLRGQISSYSSLQCGMKQNVCQSFVHLCVRRCVTMCEVDRTSLGKGRAGHGFVLTKLNRCTPLPPGWVHKAGTASCSHFQDIPLFCVGSQKYITILPFLKKTQKTELTFLCSMAVLTICMCHLPVKLLRGYESITYYRRLLLQKEKKIFI